MADGWWLMAEASRRWFRWRRLEERRRQVPRARVGRDHRDTLAWSHLARDLQRRPGNRTARHPHEQAFLPREASGERKRVFLPHLDDAIDNRAIEIRRHEARTHSLELMMAALSAREHGAARRLDGD